MRDAGVWVAVGSEAALGHLQPLIEAHRKHRPVRLVRLPGESWEDHLEGAAGLLLVGNARRAARTSLPGVFVISRNGQRIPAGWLPDVGDRLGSFAEAAVKVMMRHGMGSCFGPVAVLGERGARSEEAAARAMEEFANASLPTFRWTAERLMRNDLLVALKCGPGAALYFGHGLSQGWNGYGGIRAADLRALSSEPIGAVLSLTCGVASRWRGRFSFCEELVMSGVCAAALGAAGRSLHKKNVELGILLCRTLAATGHGILGDLLRKLPPAHLSRYRIVGDPLAPMCGAAGAASRMSAVFAPAPEDPLPVPSCWTGADTRR